MCQCNYDPGISQCKPLQTIFRRYLLLEFNQGLEATEYIIILPMNNRKQRFTAKTQSRVTSGQQCENLLCGKAWFSQGGKIKCQIRDLLLDN